MNGSPPTIPIGLSTLFRRAGFIASAPEMCKPCFKTKKYYDTSTLRGWIMRHASGETSTDTQTNVYNICEGMSQAVEQYAETWWENVIIERMIKLRIGIFKIIAAYERDKDYDTADCLKDSVLILDFRIPENRRNDYGFVTECKNLGKITSHPIPIPSGEEDETKDEENKN
jgi:hypothetical protein